MKKIEKMTKHASSMPKLASSGQKVLNSTQIVLKTLGIIIWGHYMIFLLNVDKKTLKNANFIYKNSRLCVTTRGQEDYML